MLLSKIEGHCLDENILQFLSVDLCGWWNLFSSNCLDESIVFFSLKGCIRWGICKVKRTFPLPKTQNAFVLPYISLIWYTEPSLCPPYNAELLINIVISKIVFLDFYGKTSEVFITKLMYTYMVKEIENFLDRSYAQPAKETPMSFLSLFSSSNEDDKLVTKDLCH